MTQDERIAKLEQDAAESSAAHQKAIEEQQTWFDNYLANFKPNLDRELWAANNPTLRMFLHDIRRWLTSSRRWRWSPKVD